VQSEDAGRRHAELGRVRISDYLSDTLAGTIAVPGAAASNTANLRVVT